MADRDALPSPVPTPDTVPFWTAAAEGRLLLKRCAACGRPHYYPRVYCPFCGGDTEWIEAAGRGEVHSYSVMRRADPPYVIAYVMLDEGVAMMSNVVDCDPDRVAIGLRVRAVFRPTRDGTPVPMFAPETDARA